MKDLVTSYKNSFFSKKRKQSSQSARGGVFIEVAFTLPIFLVLLFMIIELLMYSYANLTAQYVVSKVMRDFAIHQINDQNVQVDDYNDGKINVAIRNAVEKAAKDFGILAIQGGNNVAIGCDHDSLEASEEGFNDDIANNICLTNVSLFVSCSGIARNCDRVFNGNGVDIRDGDLYLLNWKFHFPMRSWFLLLGNEDNEESISNIMIRASASARLEPQI